MLIIFRMFESNSADTCIFHFSRWRGKIRKNKSVLTLVKSLRRRVWSVGAALLGLDSTILLQFFLSLHANRMRRSNDLMSYDSRRMCVKCLHVSDLKFPHESMCSLMYLKGGTKCNNEMSNVERRRSQCWCVDCAHWQRVTFQEIIFRLIYKCAYVGIWGNAMHDAIAQNERNRRNGGNIGVAFTPSNIMRFQYAQIRSQCNVCAQYRTNSSCMCKISLQFVPQNGCTTHSHPKTQLLRAHCIGLFFSHRDRQMIIICAFGLHSYMNINSIKLHNDKWAHLN